MSTTVQIEANRQNSLASTGPKTDAGKSVSSLNATTHGFNAADPVLPTEDRNQFDKLLDTHRRDFQPQTANEAFLVEELTGAQWKLNRLRRIEAAMFANLDDPAKAFQDPETAKSFARLDRYRASLERTFHRCTREIRAAKKFQNEANLENTTERKSQILEPPLQTNLKPPPQSEPVTPKSGPRIPNTLEDWKRNCDYAMTNPALRL